MSRRPRVEEVDEEEPLRPHRRPRVEEPDQYGNYPRRESIRDRYRRGAEKTIQYGKTVLGIAATAQGAIQGAKFVKAAAEYVAPDVTKWLEDRWEDVKKWFKSLKQTPAGSYTVVDAQTSAITDGSSATIPAVMM
jgi:hypothetical protein